MAAVLTRGDRRPARRVAPTAFGVARQAVMRPGVDVALVEISHGGALVESSAPIRPGARTDLALDATSGARRVLAVEVLRCWVHALTPLLFRSALRFLLERDARG
ncbi:MAG: hypothetical protein U0P30_07320 [Vicinamibacterales bacterium]